MAGNESMWLLSLEDRPCNGSEPRLTADQPDAGRPGVTVTAVAECSTRKAATYGQAARPTETTTPDERDRSGGPTGPRCPFIDRT